MFCLSFWVFLDVHETNADFHHLKGIHATSNWFKPLSVLTCTTKTAWARHFLSVHGGERKPAKWELHTAQFPVRPKPVSSEWIYVERNSVINNNMLVSERIVKRRDRIVNHESQFQEKWWYFVLCSHTVVITKRSAYDLVIVRKSRQFECIFQGHALAHKHLQVLDASEARTHAETEAHSSRKFWKVERGGLNPATGSAEVFSRGEWDRQMLTCNKFWLVQCRTRLMVEVLSASRWQIKCCKHLWLSEPLCHQRIHHYSGIHAVVPSLATCQKVALSSSGTKGGEWNGGNMHPSNAYPDTLYS